MLRSFHMWKRIHHELSRKGWTFMHLVEKGVPKGTLSRIKNSSRPNPDLATVVKIADILGVSLDLLVRGEAVSVSDTPPVAKLRRAEKHLLDAYRMGPPEFRKIVDTLVENFPMAVAKSAGTVIAPPAKDGRH